MYMYLQNITGTNEYANVKCVILNETTLNPISDI